MCHGFVILRSRNVRVLEAIALQTAQMWMLVDGSCGYHVDEIDVPTLKI